MKRGVSLEIPNKHGSYLGEILEPLDVSAFHWRTGGEESYLINADGLGPPLFIEQASGMEGELLKDLIENKSYYLIFADLKAYPKGQNITNVETYEDFLHSGCQLCLLVVDSVYITIYCKSNAQLESLYQNASEKGFCNVQYITDENDFRTRLSVW
ncbi:hypothetical protein D3C77_216950 [compost metagenome]